MVPQSLPKCFFAYPSKPKALNETIETAIERINKGGTVEAISWKSLRVTGKLVIREICAEIDKSDILVCDLTHLNPNVLFELGFAVGQNKRIWIALDSSYDSARRNYAELRLLNSIGYSGYRNAHDLVSKFYNEHPYTDLERTLYSDAIETITQSNPKPTAILYLKSPVNTEASTRLSRYLDKLSIPVVVDDPAEVTSQTLSWYVENISYAHALVTHLLDDERSKSHEVQNAKYSFVSGLAHGLGKPLLMLAHSPFTPPFDYQDLLYVHESPSECIDIIEKWLPAIEEAYVKTAAKIIGA